MSFDHHGSHPGTDGPGEIDKLLRQFAAQQKGEAPREYPRGRIDPTVDGTVVFKIGHDKKTKTVIIDFGKPVAWVGLAAKDIEKLVNTLLAHAKAISDVPLVINV